MLAHGAVLVFPVQMTPEGNASVSSQLSYPLKAFEWLHKCGLSLPYSQELTLASRFHFKMLLFWAQPMTNNARVGATACENKGSRATRHLNRFL